ncbi:MAG: hypothetical protein PHQ61_06620 [Candidatus Omnitrophica bacterium]|nr:hypothetical protein [Candidatus Omnitrophota bacterium]
MDKIEALGIYEKRCVSDDRIELVFFDKDIAAWNNVLISELGGPVKKAGEKPSREDLEITEIYGGLYQDQTLFRKETDGGVIIGMFWPWQSAPYITLKLIFIKNMPQ